MNSQFRNAPRVSGVKFYAQAHDERISRTADTLSSLLRLSNEELVALFKSYSFYDSEFTPMIQSVLKTFGASGQLTDKQKVSLAMYLASHPEGARQ